MKKKLLLFLISTCWCLTGILHAQTTESFVYDGINRSYIVYTPPSYVPGSAMPLVFVLHGFTQTSQAIMDVSGFNAIADTANFIVVYPNGVGNAWNSNSGMTGGSTADDIGFIAALTDTMFSRYGVDTARVFSCGFSAGGYMSHRLACESSRCYAAVASVAGTMSTAAYAACVPTRPVPVLQIHGTSDAIVSYNGGIGGVSVDDVISKWTAIDFCPATPVITALPNTNLFDNSTVESSVYGSCAAGSEVKLLKVIGGGHQWPGTTALLGGLGTINRDINASGEIWNFFRRFSCTNSTSTVNTIDEQGITLEQLSANSYVVHMETPQPFSYTVFDLNGREILNGTSANENTIDISSVSSGCFVLLIRTETSYLSYRLLR